MLCCGNFIDLSKAFWQGEKGSHTPVIASNVENRIAKKGVFIKEIK